MRPFTWREEPADGIAAGSEPNRFLIAVWIVLLAGAAFASSPAPAAMPASTSSVRLLYNRDVRPILSENCFLCHGPDKNTRKGKLRLDVRADALARQAIAPGRPDASLLVARLFTTDRDEVMPPPDSHRSVSAAQKELLRRWIAEGAEYQPHWSYVKPVRPEIPTVGGAAWVRNPIDAFILKHLEGQGVRPAPPAERRTLLRRVSLDLIGLPPTPAELAAFVNDRDPLAYEKQVDRLLASAHFGERMAVPWLDAVRFSDTVGYHGDQNQRIFPYRDYVIGAFNANKSFAAFTVEQLAGDLLPNPTVEQRIATGFNRLNMMTREGGAQPREYLAKYAADRVRTVASAWLGSTLGCAECHDHKFDPFRMRDFYSMEAFFADVRQWGVYSDYKYTPNPDLKGWSNDHPFPPEMEVPSDYLQQRLKRLQHQQQDQLLAWFARVSSTPDFGAWLDGCRALAARYPQGWRVLEAIKPGPASIATPTNSAGHAEVPPAINRSPAVPGPDSGAHAPEEQDATAVSVVFGPKEDDRTIELQLVPGPVAALRLELLQADTEERLGPGEQVRGLRLAAVLRREGRERKLVFHRADADHKQPRYASGEELIGILAGWKPVDEAGGARPTAVWLPEPPLEAHDGDRLIVRLRSAGSLTARFAVSPFAAGDPLAAGLPPAFRSALDAGGGASDDTVRRTLAEHYLVSVQADAGAFAQFKNLEREILLCRGGRVRTMVTVAGTPAITRVLPRGNWQDDSGDIVAPAPPLFLSSPPPAETRWTRLDLARWLVSPDNPLTARVFVNRLWKQFFGAGLSAMVDDLGSQGEWPLHAELLDWLAVEFMNPAFTAPKAAAASGPWDMRHMVRLLVTSATYRQQATRRPDLNEVDPQNRWWAEQNPRRLEAEFVRDNALFAAGLLNLEIGGPSARPYQPGGYYEALQFPDRDYVASADERQYRRGLYMHWQRTFLHPMLANFDAPAREECTATRNVSNTPQQALTLLNDPTFVEAARVLATRLLRQTDPSDRTRLDHAYDLVLGRGPKNKEADSLLRFLAGQRQHYAAHDGEAAGLLRVGLAPPAPPAVNEVELAAWTELCRVLLNTHECITRY